MVCNNPSAIDDDYLFQHFEGFHFANLLDPSIIVSILYSKGIKLNLIGFIYFCLYREMKFVCFFLVPVWGFSPVIFRYLRIKVTTNPMLKEVGRRSTAQIVASFIPGLPMGHEDILKDTVYECVANNSTVLAGYVAKHLLLQFMSHEINDGFHEALHKMTSIGG